MCGLRVTGDHHAVAAVQVDVLGAVDVPHSRTLAVTDPDGGRTEIIQFDVAPPAKTFDDSSLRASDCGILARNRRSSSSIIESMVTGLLSMTATAATLLFSC